MASEYRLSYTASEIDNRLGMVGDALLCVPQTLTEEQRAQVIENIGINIYKDVYYYANLSTAINDINNDVTSNAMSNIDNACVKMFIAESGKLTVSLLADISESSTIIVNKDIDIMLAGHTINFDVAGAYLSFAEGTTCTINGEVAGSSIVKGKINENGNATITSGKSSNDRVCFIEANGDSLTIRGGEYSLEVNAGYVMHLIRVNATSKQINLFDCNLHTRNIVERSNAAAYNISSPDVIIQAGKLLAENVNFSARTSQTTCTCIVSSNNAETTIRNCNIYAVTDTDASVTSNDKTTTNYVRAITINGGILHIEDSTINADAPGCNSDKAHSVGIWSIRNDDFLKVIYVTNTNIYATLAAIENCSSLYVRGGILSGYSHGGLYAKHDASKNHYVYLKDVQLWSSYYNGKFPIEIIHPTGTSPIGSNCYIGSNPYQSNEIYAGGDVYMDGCTFGFEGVSPYLYSICVRDSSYESKIPNRLFISNSKFIGHKNIRIQGGDKLTPAELYMGKGCDFGSDFKVVVEGDNCKVEENNELYRKHYAGEALTAEDFAALIDGVSASVSYPDGDEVSY